MSRRALVPIGITLLILALAAGCRIGALGSLERSAPMPSAPASPLAAMHGRSFYPLDLGNRWHYVRTFSSTWVDELGTPQEFNVTSALERELRCETALGARSYMAERTLEVAPNGTYLSWVYYRQDRNGLYEADDPTPPPCDSPPPPEETGPGLHAVALSSIAEPGRLPEDPAARAAMVTLEQRLALVRYTLGLPAPSMHRPRPAAGEIVRLAYPLHTGQRWVIRAQPRFTSTVEGVDVLRLPAGRFVAHRIRINSELFGPNDRVRVWYGREGFLQLDAHLESQGVDPYGNVYPVQSDDRERLDGIDLIDGGLD